jgi:hypothetical protein
MTVNDSADFTFTSVIRMIRYIGHTPFALAKKAPFREYYKANAAAYRYVR